MPDACCTAERPHTEPIATLPPGITHYVTTGSPFTGADQAVQDEDPWRCTVCGSTRPVRARAGRASDGAPLMAQCVENGHWNKPPKAWSSES